MVQRQGDGIGLYGVINHTVGDGNQDGKYSCPDTVAKAVLQIVSRAAAETVSVFPGHLVNLGQGGFHETGGRTDDGNKPHPENSAGAAGDDGNGNTRNISHPYTGSGTDTECLERRNLISLRLPAGGVGNQLKHPSKVPNLHPSGADGEIKPCAHQQGNNNG